MGATYWATTSPATTTSTPQMNSFVLIEGEKIAPWPKSQAQVSPFYSPALDFPKKGVSDWRHVLEKSSYRVKTCARTRAGARASVGA